MNNIILLRTSMHMLLKHTVRSSLTMLGVIIGIAAIIVTFSIGSCAQERVREQIMALGENAIYIIRGNIFKRGSTQSDALGEAWLKERDLEAIIKQVPSITFASRGQDSLNKTEYGIQSIQDFVWGVDPEMLTISQNTILYGTFFSDKHVKERAKVAVLAYNSAEKLFGKENPVGKTVLIDNIPFTVIGKIDKISYFLGGRDPNDKVYVPYSVADRLFATTNQAEGDMGFAALKVAEDASSEEAVRQIRRILRFSHKLDDDDPDDFTILEQQSIARSADIASQIIKLFGLIAAFISLIVGGVGLMNIMLVSVSERTREIGVRLAIGATQGNIRKQFLLEALVLCTAGGTAGAIIGSVLQYILGVLTNLPGTIQLIPVLLSLLVTIAIGLFFGYYPAYKASILNPVDALREQ